MLDLLIGRIDDAVATVFRQIALNRFEHAVHTGRREEGELPIERISELWSDEQRRMLGDAVEVTDGYGIWWSYVPHFIQTPGYVYAYSFGYLFSLAIYRRYLDEGEALVEPYLDLLRAGGLGAAGGASGAARLRHRRPGLLVGGPRRGRRPRRRGRAARRAARRLGGLGGMSLVAGVRCSFRGKDAGSVDSSCYRRD